MGQNLGPYRPPVDETYSLEVCSKPRSDETYGLDAALNPNFIDIQRQDLAADILLKIQAVEEATCNNVMAVRSIYHALFRFMLTDR